MKKYLMDDIEPLIEPKIAYMSPREYRSLLSILLHCPRSKNQYVLTVS